MSKQTVHQLMCDRCKTLVYLDAFNGPMPNGWSMFTQSEDDEATYWYHLCTRCTQDMNRFMENHELVQDKEIPHQEFGFGSMA